MDLTNYIKTASSKAYIKDLTNYIETASKTCNKDLVAKNFYTRYLSENNEIKDRLSDLYEK